MSFLKNMLIKQSELGHSLRHLLSLMSNTKAASVELFSLFYNTRTALFIPTSYNKIAFKIDIFTGRWNKTWTRSVYIWARSTVLSQKHKNLCLRGEWKGKTLISEAQQLHETYLSNPPLWTLSLHDVLSVLQWLFNAVIFFFPPLPCKYIVISIKTDEDLQLSTVINYTAQRLIASTANSF